MILTELYPMLLFCSLMVNWFLHNNILEIILRYTIGYSVYVLCAFLLTGRLLNYCFCQKFPLQTLVLYCMVNMAMQLDKELGLNILTNSLAYVVLYTTGLLVIASELLYITWVFRQRGKKWIKVILRNVSQDKRPVGSIKESHR